jgi:bifunctional DNase/RNase
MDIEMKIRGLMMDPVTNMPIVVLKDVNGDTILPIWVGIPEAHAIYWEIEKVAPARPMTHDLLKNALQGLNAIIQKVVVNELRDDTFYAIICLEQDGHQVMMDARPSDAIALALRADCPVYVSEEVLRNSRVAASGTESMTPDDLRRWLENLNDEDLGRYKM